MIVALSVLFAWVSHGATTTCDIFEEINKQDPGREGVNMILGKDADKMVTVSQCDSADLDKVIQTIYSASKVVTTTLINMMAADGKFSLDDKLSKFFDWWTTDENDDRSKVTVRHLMTQTGGLADNTVCLFSADTTFEKCAKEVYNTYGFFYYNLQQVPLEFGKDFQYAESNFMFMVQIAIQTSGIKKGGYNAVFKKYIADKAGIDMERCNWQLPTVDFVGGGAGLACSINEYAKFLGAYFNGDLVSKEVYDEMEKRGTPNFYDEERYAGNLAWSNGYAMGMWTYCPDNDCEKGKMVHSIGAGGFFPFWDREKGYWAVIGRANGLGSCVPGLCDSVDEKCYMSTEDKGSCDVKTGNFVQDKRNCVSTTFCRECMGSSKCGMSLQKEWEPEFYSSGMSSSGLPIFRGELLGMIEELMAGEPDATCSETNCKGLVCTELDKETCGLFEPVCKLKGKRCSPEKCQKLKSKEDCDNSEKCESKLNEKKQKFRRCTKVKK